MDRPLFVGLITLAALAHAEVQFPDDEIWRKTTVPFTSLNPQRNINLRCSLTCFDFCDNGECTLISCDYHCPLSVVHETYENNFLGLNGNNNDEGDDDNDDEGEDGDNDDEGEDGDNDEGNDNDGENKDNENDNDGE